MKLANFRFSLAVCALMAVFSLSAQASYSAANVKGSYSFLVNEWTATTGNNFGSLGILTFDGVSAVSGSLTEVTSSGLQTFTIETGSTYSVKASGSGSISLTTTGGGITLDFVLNSVSASVAQGLQLLSPNPSGGNYVTAGNAVAMNLSGSASAANLKGSYSFLGTKWTADPAAAQNGSVGIATFDGVSKVNVSFTEVYDGTVETLSGSGTYTVNSDGTGTLTLPDKDGGTIDFVLTSVVNSIAKSVQYLSANSTTDGVSTGTAVFQ